MDRISDLNNMYIINQSIIDNDILEQTLEIENWSHQAEEDSLDNFYIEQEI